MESPYRHPGFWGLVAAACLLSSLLGLLTFPMGFPSGFLFVWSRSVAADVVFIAATAAAFATTSLMPNRLWPLTALAGLSLHSVVYLLSWATATTAEKLENNGPIVLAFGAPGLVWCTVASPLLARHANRIRSRPAPAGTPMHAEHVP